MSVTPVAATGLESLASDPGTDAPAAGFDLLLADAAAPETDADARRTDDARTDDARKGEPVASEHQPTKHGPADKSSKAPGADDAAGALALGAPVAVVTPTPVPAPRVAAPAGAGDAAAETPTVPVTAVPIAPVDTAPPDSDPAPADPPVTEPPTIDLAEVLEGVLDSTGPSTPVVSAPAPAANLADLVTPDAPTPRAATSDVPVLTSADHIRLLSASTPARTVAANAGPLEATSPAPPAPAPASSTTIVEAAVTTPVATTPPAAEQVVSVLRPLHAAPNGSYTLHLELKPPELGRIELRVEMRDGVMHASIHSDREASAQMLRDALSDLRERLDGAGVRSGSLTVSDGGVGARDRDGTNAHGQPGATGRDDLLNAGDNTPMRNAAGTDPESETTSLLDVRV